MREEGEGGVHCVAQQSTQSRGEREEVGEEGYEIAVRFPAKQV